MKLFRGITISLILMASVFLGYPQSDQITTELTGENINRILLLVLTNQSVMISNELVLQRIASTNGLGPIATNLGAGATISASNGDQLTNAIATKTANYTLTSGDGVVLLTGNHVASIPTAVAIPGRTYTIKCVTAGTNLIIALGSQTIDGTTRRTNTAIYKFHTIISDGTNWHIIGQN